MPVSIWALSFCFIFLNVAVTISVKMENMEYRIKLLTQLTHNHNQRRDTVNWLSKYNAGFPLKFICSAKGRFTLDGFVNKKNCSI